MGGALVIAWMHAGMTSTAPVAHREKSVRLAQRVLATSPVTRDTRHVIAARHRQNWDHDLHAVPPQGEFSRLYHVRATAYMPRRIEGGRFTYTERDGRAAHGIAVDPHLIPLGTRLWIPGYGNALADDVGSAIQGHRIDVRVQEHEQMAAWGVRDLRVYVLADR